MKYRGARRLKKIELLFFVIILLQSIQFSGCVSLFRVECPDCPDETSVSTLDQPNQRPFQDEMDVPEYLTNSFDYDETSFFDGIYRERRSNIPCQIWRQLLNSTMATLKYDYITQLCLYSVGAESHYKRAFLLDVLGYDDLAAIEYTEAIALNSQDDRYYNNRGNLYMLRGFTYLAVRDFTKAIELNPNRAEPYYNRARALEKMGKSSEAQLDYEMAVKLGICRIYPSLKVCK